MKLTCECRECGKVVVIEIYDDYLTVPDGRAESEILSDGCSVVNFYCSKCVPRSRL